MTDKELTDLAVRADNGDIDYDDALEWIDTLADKLKLARQRIAELEARLAQALGGLE